MTLCEAAWKGTSADLCGVHWGGSGQRGRHSSNITAAESSPLERVSSGTLETGLLKTHYCYLLASCYSNHIGGEPSCERPVGPAEPC